MSYYYRNKSDASTKSAIDQRVVNYTRTKSENCAKSCAFELHNHDIFELTTVTKGRFTEKIDDRSYEVYEGDIIIANPYELHEGFWTSDEECEYLTLTCSLNTILFSGFGGMKEHLHDLLSSKCGFKTKIGADEPCAKEIASLVKRGYEACIKSGVPDNLEAISRTFEIFSILFKHYYGVLPHRVRKNNKDFFKSVTAYLEENYKNKIGTSDVSAALFMSKSQFCHNFKKYYNDSFSKFLCKYRVMKAVKQNQEGTSLLEISRSVGFTSYHYFARAFNLHLGCSPSDYFKSKNGENEKNG